MSVLICDICGLPTVPFGGEDICLSEAHEHGYDELSYVPDDHYDYDGEDDE